MASSSEEQIQRMEEKRGRGDTEESDKERNTDIHKNASGVEGYNPDDFNLEEQIEMMDTVFSDLANEPNINEGIDKLVEKELINQELQQGKIPEEVQTVWEKAIREITEEQMMVDEENIEIHKSSMLQKIKDIITKREIEFEKYDIVKHGPLVDLSGEDNSGVREIELYPINPPYSYIRILYDMEIHEYQYKVIEPELTDMEKRLLEDIKSRLIETLDIDLKETEKSDAKDVLRSRFTEFLKDYRIDLSPANREKLTYYIQRDFLGYGDIDAVMLDSDIEDISCDGPATPIYVYHKKYESIPSSITFDLDEKLDSFVIRMAQICGKHISIANPLLDATMPDGSRIQLTLGREVTTYGSTFTIRRFNENPITPPQLIGFHTYSTAMMAFLWLAVESNKSIIFAGGTASGKTTSMNAISMFIQPEMKLVSIEDTRELNLAHPNWIPGVTRQAFAGEERGSIGMYELLRASLRQRPEYILVGEVRGAEAYVLFQAMSTGHTTFSTIHADSVQSIVHRLENPPINVPRIMIQALDVVCVQAQVKVGEDRVRRCKSITEIVGVDPRTGELLTNEVFLWGAGKDSFQYSGRSYVIESLMLDRGWDDATVRKELQQRQDVIEWALQRGISNYKDFSKIIVAYKREPETIIKLVKQEMQDE